MEETGILTEPKIKKGIFPTWIKGSRINIYFVLIIILALIVRLYFFWITKSQPVWWDESTYLAVAKSYAGIVDYPLEGIRLPGFPIFLALFYFVGISSEQFLRFFALFVPSILMIAIFFFLISEMYKDKRVAIVSTIILIFLWENVFYSNRFHTENIALIFEFLAILFFFKIYLKQERFLFLTPKNSFFVILALSAMSVFFRPGNIIFFPAILLAFLYLERKFILEHKKFSIISAIALGVLFFITFQLPFVKNLLSVYASSPTFFALEPLNVFYGFYAFAGVNLIPIFFFTFLAGLFFVFFNLSFREIRTFQKGDFHLNKKSDLFNLVLLLSVLFFFMFVMKAHSYEYRWFFPLLPAMLVITSRGIIDSADLISAFFKNKKAGFIFLVVLVVMGGYTQFEHADFITKNKLESYSQIRDAGVWMGENIQKDSIVFSESVPQLVYYSNKPVIDIPNNFSEFQSHLQRNETKYIIISSFENHPSWVNEWVSGNIANLDPEKVDYMTINGEKQVVLVIYRVRN